MLKAFGTVVKQGLVGSSTQAMISIERIVSIYGPQMCEEWREIFRFVDLLVRNEKIREHKDSYESIIKMFGTIRALYISERFKGNSRELMNVYLQVKDMINDPTFDGLYLNYIMEKSSLQTLEENLVAFFDTTLNAKKPKALASIDRRVTYLFNMLRDLYENVTDVERESHIESFVVSKCTEWLGMSISVEAKLKVVQLLKNIAFRTTSRGTFYGVLQKFSATFYEMQEADFQIVDMTTSRLSQTEMVPAERNSVGFSVHQILFQLFQSFYLDFPPARLADVLVAFLHSLKSSNDETKLLTLNFLAELDYDRSRCLRLKLWNVSSQLAAAEMAGCVFAPMRIVTAAVEVATEDKNKKLVIAAIEVLIKLVGNPYSLYEVDLRETVNKLIGLLRNKVKKGEFEIALKVAEFFELIIALKDNRESKRLPSEDYSVLIFDECVIHLDTLCQEYRKEMDKRLKSKAGKKYQSSPTRHHAEMKLFREPPFQQSAKLARKLLKTIRKYFYVSGIGLADRVEGLVAVLRVYVEDHVLAEEFCSPVQKLIAGLDYSEIVFGLSSDSVIGLIDLCVKTGWRNVFYLSNTKFSTLEECLKGNFTCSPMYALTSILNASTAQNEAKFASTVSSLTFPNNQSGKKLEEEIESRLKKKTKTAERLYFEYQRDFSYLMHEIAMNIVILFTHLNRVDKEKMVYYLLHIVRQEMENESSPILSQSVALAELLSWYLATNSERTVPVAPHSKGKRKLWVMNDCVLDVQAEANKARVEVRNVVSHSLAVYEVPTSPFKSQCLSKDTKKCLANLRANQQADIASTELESLAIEPEHVINNFPCSLAMRVNEKALCWSPVKAGAEIEQSINALDELPVHNLYAVAVLYVAAGCPFANEEIYTQASWSEDFEVFLSRLGNLVDVRRCSENYEYLGAMPRSGADGCYGILWKNSLSQVFFHVNVLFQYIDEAASKYEDSRKRSKAEPIFSVEEDKELSAKPRLATSKASKYIESDDVWVIWNESGNEVPREFLKDKKTKTILIVTPLANGYSVIQLAKVLLGLNIEWSNDGKEDSNAQRMYREVCAC